ncbi:MAG: hypothetical protein RL346_1555 [Verrucomicrobiota bacterium]|jgi:hypothetical protein
MNPLESVLLGELTGGAQPRLLLRSRTRIDAGRWWRRTPVWICITHSELILFAVARRTYAERVPLAECHASHYAAMTGELVIEPAESLRVKHLALTPKEALGVLDFLKKQPSPF